MRTIVRNGFFAVGGLLALLLLAVATLYGVSGSHFGETLVVETPALDIPTDSLSIAHGAHLIRSRGCHDCHGENLEGSVFIDDPAIGRFVGTNLTPGAGGVGKSFQPADWDRAIRHGLGLEGRTLLFMPSYEFNHWSDEDMAAIIAYMQTLEPIDNELPSVSVGPIGRALYLKGDMPLVAARMIDHAPRTRSAPEAGPTVEYGAYVAPGCTGCHGPGFSGGPVPGTPPNWPPATNITMHESGLADWTEEDFLRALRDGVRPDGSELQQPFMPIAVTSTLHDYEITALWAYLNTVTPRETGQR